jgi:LAGLIDADG endonuclease
MKKMIMIKNNKEKFNSYLAGLFEGDGHIWMPKFNMKKKHNPRFCITFNIKNEPLAKKLLEIIDYGFIRYKPKDNACVLVISPVKGLKFIIECINGELRTPKIIQLHNLIDWINKNHSSEIKKLPIKKGNLDKDNWFAGFVDADGSFSIQHTKLEDGAKKRKISCRLRIEQRMYEPLTKNSYFDVLNEISTFLNCNLNTRKQTSTGNKYFIIAASSRKSLLIIMTYFKNFSLYSSKYLDYKDWEQAANLIIENNHYTEKGIIKINDLKDHINLKRTYFNWDHLNNLY